MKKQITDLLSMAEQQGFRIGEMRDHLQQTMETQDQLLCLTVLPSQIESFKERIEQRLTDHHVSHQAHYSSILDTMSALVTNLDGDEVTKAVEEYLPEHLPDSARKKFGMRIIEIADDIERHGVNIQKIDEQLKRHVKDNKTKPMAYKRIKALEEKSDSLEATVAHVIQNECGALFRKYKLVHSRVCKLERIEATLKEAKTFESKVESLEGVYREFFNDNVAYKERVASLEGIVSDLCDESSDYKKRIASLEGVIDDLVTKYRDG